MADFDFIALIEGRAELKQAKQDFLNFKQQAEQPIKLTFDTNGLNAIFTGLGKQAQQSGIQVANSFVQSVQKNIRSAKVGDTAIKSMFDGIVPDGKLVFNGGGLESIGTTAQAVKALKKELQGMSSGALLKSFRFDEEGKSFMADITDGANATIKVIGQLGDILNDQGEVVGHRWQTNQTYVVDYTSTIKQAQKESQALADKVKEIGDAFSTGAFDKEVSKMESAFANVGKDVSSDDIKKMSDAATEYYRITQQIQDSLSGKSANPLQGQDLADAYGRSQLALQSFNNAYAEMQSNAKAAGIETGNAMKQAQNEAQKLATQVDKVSQSFITGEFDKNITKMEQGLMNLSDSVSSEVVKKMSDAAAEYYRITQQIADSINNPNQPGALQGQDLADAYKKQEIALRTFKNAQDEARASTQKMLAEGSGARHANQLETWARNNSKALKKYGDQIDEIAQKMRNAKTQGELNDAINDAKNLKAEITSAGYAGQSFADQFKRAFVHIGEFTGIYAFTSMVRQLPREMAQEVLKIDTAMTELRKVSTASASEISNYFEQATESAYKYGQTINEVIDSTAAWTRLGYDLKDASILTDVTAELAQVGSGLDTKSATEGLQATIRGFGLAAEDAKRVGDLINEVADTKPIDALGIINGLERSSAAMKEMNNSLEETIGLITATTSVTQDATSAGTAWRTISLRIAGAKNELEEAGLETDGMVESTAKLREEILAVAGVDILDATGKNFKSTYQIMKELAQVWKDLDGLEKSGLMDKIAGLRKPVRTEMCV